MKKQYPKYRSNFKARIKTLEKNYQDCSDPFIEGYESIFRKNNYELPEEYTNPTKFAQSGTKSSEKSLDGGESSIQKNKRRAIPSLHRTSNLNVADKQLHEMAYDGNQRKRKNSRITLAENSQINNREDTGLPKSISKQLLDTLSKWEPVNSKWTIC